MYLKQAINLERKFRDRVMDLFRTARTNGYDDRFIRDGFFSIMKSYPKNFSLMRRHAIELVYYALYDDMMERDIEFCYKVDEKIYSSNKISKFVTTRVFDPVELHQKKKEGAFFWRETQKQFTPWKNT